MDSAFAFADLCAQVGEASFQVLLVVPTIGEGPHILLDHLRILLGNFVFAMGREGYEVTRDMLQRSIQSVWQVTRDMLQRSIQSVWQVTRNMLQRSIQSVWQVTRDMLQRSIQSVWQVTRDMLQRSIQSVWQVTRDMLQRTPCPPTPPPTPPPHPVPQENHTILRAILLTEVQYFKLTCNTSN